jgi:hypothetical protein
MNFKDIDWTGLMIILVMLFGAVLVCYYLIVTDVNSCTRDPIKYAMKSVELPAFISQDDLTDVELTLYSGNLSVYNKKIPF